ncbi:hypothetical protein HS088_TW19G00136 [Tripterygium wilfordii]|uniref:RNI-like superfamily protein n=1 Tax=Tripterygium wilfordii TaxID=458696 RepID=A0A7J7C9D4_TRIWF|nr:uncharacterized protein LOC119985065 isoform X2 [Tripterygium wilfordii]KAF5730545.1 hypothetical protein HS088_TW19G00136 [Tripterygium wilfordii]
MEKDKPAAASAKGITNSLKNLDLSPNYNPKYTATIPKLACKRTRTKPPSLSSLCLGVIGRHLEDIIPELGGIAVSFPADIKMAMAAIARRRKLLNDDVIISLADSAWGVLDISGSDVSDSGLAEVAGVCTHLRAVDISRCKNITAVGVSELVQNCKSLETLRCGGCPRSDFTARRCLGIFKPKLNDVKGDSWEELDMAEIGHSAESLRWLVWPKIDKDSLETLATECPRISVNPKASPFGFRGAEVPIEVSQDIALDDRCVEDVDPQTWAVSGFTLKTTSPSLSSPTELSLAEKFRLAFVERDTRLAPKRAKNARQHQRRAEREWRMTNTEAKAIALAAKASKSLQSRN